MYTSTTHAPGTCVEGSYVSYFTVAKEPVCTLQQHTLQVHVLRGYMSLISLLGMYYYSMLHLLQGSWGNTAIQHTMQQWDRGRSTVHTENLII